MGGGTSESKRADGEGGRGEKRQGGLDQMRQG